MSITVTALGRAEDRLREMEARVAEFSALAARLSSGDWFITSWPSAPSVNGVRITVAATGERFSAERLADAVRMALESEATDGDK